MGKRVKQTPIVARAGHSADGGAGRGSNSRASGTERGPNGARVYTIGAKFGPTGDNECRPDANIRQSERNVRASDPSVLTLGASTVAIDHGVHTSGEGVGNNHGKICSVHRSISTIDTKFRDPDRSDWMTDAGVFTIDPSSRMIGCFVSG